MNNNNKNNNKIPHNEHRLSLKGICGPLGHGRQAGPGSVIQANLKKFVLNLHTLHPHTLHPKMQLKGLA